MNKENQTILTRGVSEIIDKDSLEKKLLSGQKLRIKLGIDPTSPNLHLGRSIPLLKLGDFQKAGHQIVFIVGDFTGTVGDTSDKESERPMLDAEIVKQNMATYINQAGKIIDIDRAEIVYNSAWLTDLDFAKVGFLADSFSVSDFIARDNIKRRLDAGNRVSLRELLYPLMQGYDSVVVKSDVELGGNDQRFNMLAGRTLQKVFGQTPQDIVMNPLIEGLDGRKMSSSFGNTVNLTDNPNDMFGKIMTVGDELIIKYFEYLTRIEMEEIDKYQSKLDQGENPKNIKLELALEITKMYHGTELAQKAKAYFENTFSKKIMPDEIPEFAPKDYRLAYVLVETNLANSKSDAVRVINQGGVKINEEVITDPNFIVPKNAVLQKGKIHFLRIV